MTPYRKNIEKVLSETPSTEQKISDLYLKYKELEQLVHQHPNILLQLKYNQLNVEINKLKNKIGKPNYYKYLFIILFVFNILKFISEQG